MTTDPAQSHGVLAGFGLPFEGGRLLLADRRLWAPAVVPFALSLLAFAAALALVVANAGAIHTFVTEWMPVVEATRWYTWLWIGPAWLGLRLLGLVLFAAVAGAALLVAYLLASLAAAPFHDVLAQRVERVVTGDVRDAGDGSVMSGVRDVGRSLREEAQRLLFFVAVVAPLALVGFVVPGAHLLTGPAIVLFTVLFLPLDYASYALDRRHLGFRRKRRWILDHLPMMVGFGAAAFLAVCIPVVNFAAMPMLVVGGTLLALRLDPERADQAEANR